VKPIAVSPGDDDFMFTRLQKLCQVLILEAKGSSSLSGPVKRHYFCSYISKVVVVICLCLLLLLLLLLLMMMMMIKKKKT